MLWDHTITHVHNRQPRWRRRRWRWWWWVSDNSINYCEKSSSCIVSRMASMARPIASVRGWTAADISWTTDWHTHIHTHTHRHPDTQTHTYTWTHRHTYCLQQQCSPKNLFLALYDWWQYLQRLLRVSALMRAPLPLVKADNLTATEQERSQYCLQTRSCIWSFDWY